MRTIEFRQHESEIRANERPLAQDIAYLERRLEEMGYNGDCAYERAMSGTFEKLLVEKRQALARLRDTHLAA